MSNAIETAKFLRRYQSWRKGEIDVFYPDSHAGPNPVEISAAIDRAIAALEAQPPCGADGAVTFALDYYDAGLLGDGGGGNVEWWQDYMRSELSRAHDCYQSQIDANHQPAAPVAPAIQHSGVVMLDTNECPTCKRYNLLNSNDIPEQVIRDIVGAYHRRLTMTNTEAQDEKERDFQRAAHLRTALEWLVIWLNNDAAPVAPATVAVPDGFVLVPVNPTREMISAGDAANDGIVSDIYRAMVSQVVKESFTTAVPRVPFSMPDAAVERIYDAARRSFRRFASSVRGQMVTKAGGYEWHVINATLDEVRSMLDASQREGGGT